MAFNAYGFRTLALGGTIGNGPGGACRLHHYATNDTAAVVEAAGYFDALAASIGKGDLIIASLDVDGTPASRTYIVAANSGTAVTIAASQATAIA